MKRLGRLIRASAGHLALLLVAAIFVAGWRAGVNHEWLAMVPDAADAPVTTSLSGTIPPVETAATADDVNMADVPILDDASLAPILNPVTFEGAIPEHSFITYTVKRGDTPAGIAESFGIKPETLLGGNPFLSEESSLLRTDVVLTILPIDGVLHTVEPGDTLEGLAGLYNVPVEAIIAYEPNNLAFPYRLYPETHILVPGAVREVFVWTPPSLPSVATGGAYWGSQAAPVIVGTGTFIWPISGRRITQYFWYGHQALDVGVPVGTSVYAADTGTVVYAAWNAYCFGNLIVINHGNGAETFYAHLSQINVVPGQIVYQGNLIGATGNTGCSSGPHIHFEIRWTGVRSDPLAWLR